MDRLTVNIETLQNVEWNPLSNPRLSVPLPYAHVWKFAVSDNLTIKYQEVLEMAEQQRYLSFHLEADRARYLTARYWLKHVLGKYLGRDMADIEIRNGRNNKPYLYEPAFPAIHFNLSHAGEYILLAFSNHEIGIDIEMIRPEFEFSDIIDHHFSKEEKEYICSDSKPIRPFFSLWTRKEAILKADGSGLIDNLAIIPSLTGFHQLPPGICSSSQVLRSFSIDEGYIASISFDKNIHQADFYTMPASILREPLTSKSAIYQA